MLMACQPKEENWLGYSAYEHCSFKVTQYFEGSKNVVSPLNENMLYFRKIQIVGLKYFHIIACFILEYFFV